MVTRIHTQNLLDEGGTRYLVEQLVQRLVTGNLDLTDYVKKDELQEIIDELDIDIDLSDYATEQYVREQIAQALVGDEIDLSDYVLKSDVEQSTQEDYKDLTNPASVGYVQAYVEDAMEELSPQETDLTEYVKRNELNEKLDEYAKKEEYGEFATKEYVDTADEEYSQRKKVTIEGTQIGINAEPIKTYAGGTVLTFPNEVTLRVYLEDGELERDKYVEYTGSTITIPDTKDGYLTDYIIYGLEFKRTVADPNILDIHTDYEFKGTNSKPLGYAWTNWSSTSDVNIYKVDLDAYDWYNWEEARFIQKDFVPEEMYEHFGIKDVNGTFISVPTEILPYAKNWSQNLDLMNDGMRKDIYNRYHYLWESNTYTSIRPPVCPLGADIGYNNSSSELQTALAKYGTRTGSKPMGVKLTSGGTYTIESITGKPFAIVFNTMGSPAAFIRKWSYAYANGSSTYSNYRYIKAYWENGLTTNLRLSQYYSNDGASITFTNKSPEVTGLSGGENIIYVLCENNDDYDSIRITKGDVSYSDLTNDNVRKINITSKNTDSSSTDNVTLSVNTTDIDIENGYIRYSDNTIYHRYDMDDYYTKNEIVDLLGVIENGSY